MANKIRLVRILEYTYDDPEQYFRDIQKWGVCANGVETHGSLTIRSATLPAEEIKVGEDA